MVSAGYAPKCHFVWSDGCASQFKSSKPWYFVSQYPAMTNGCEMLWSFFGSAHGKGPHDGAGAVVKRFIRKEQLNAHGAKLTCAADVVQFLKENLAERPESSYTGARKPMKRMFWHIGANDVKHKDEAHDCDVVQGTRKIHSIRAANKTNLTQLLVKNLACFCCFCMQKDWDSCPNLEWTGPWLAEHLQPRLMKPVRDAMTRNWLLGDLEFGSNADDLAATLDSGDNFAVTAPANNVEGVEFYIICCIRGVHTVRKAFSCEWGTDFEIGDTVVSGKYYQKWGQAQSASYIFLKDSHIVYMHSYHVRAVKFLMLPSDQRVSGNVPIYKLPIEAYRGIISGIGDLDSD